jgi:CHAT domain-containing protein/Tfp pilus assembly protein PilF
MKRFLPQVNCLLIVALISLAPVWAEDQPVKLTPEERKALENKRGELNTAGLRLYEIGKYPESTVVFQEALVIARQLYTKIEFPSGHANLTQSLNNLAALYQAQGKFSAAEPLFKEALEVYKHLYKEQDHPSLATSLNNLGYLLGQDGQLAKAEPLLKEALEMRKRLYKDKDHPNLAQSLDNLGCIYMIQGRFSAAEPLLKEALEIRKRLFKNQDHPELAHSLNHLASLYKDQSKFSTAEPFFKDALEMYKRLHKGTDHAHVAQGLNDLGFIYLEQGKLSDSEPLFKDALGMYQRLYKDKDHSDVANCRINLASLYRRLGRLSEAEPLYKDVLEMRKRLFNDHEDVAKSLFSLGNLYQSQGKLSRAESLYQEGFEMCKRLFKDKDHPTMALCLNNLGMFYQSQGKWVAAESFFKGALEMRQRLFKSEDHLDLAISMNHLGMTYKAQGKLSAAESLIKDALEMQKRVFKSEGHPDLASSLSNLGSLYYDQGRLADAEPVMKNALEMTQRLVKYQDHPDLARDLNNLATLYWRQGKFVAAELIYKHTLEMHKRLYKNNDHIDVARFMNNLAILYWVQGKLSAAEPLFKEAMEMAQRLSNEKDNPDLARILNCLGGLYEARGQLSTAESHLMQSLEMRTRLIVSYAKQKSEGEALTLSLSQTLTLDALLSVTRTHATQSSTYNPTTVYPAVWTKKGMIARIFEERQLQCRVAATDPALAKMLDQLAEARRRRAELILTPPDSSTLQQREANLKEFENTIARLNESLPNLLPAMKRVETLAKASVADLQKALPADAAFVDYVHYSFFQYDQDRPAGEKQKNTKCYLAFVVTSEKLVRVELEAAEKIETAVLSWREAITSGTKLTDTVPAKVRKLVWEKVQKALPPGIKTLYICPDKALCKVPFAALPGDKPGTLLLEEFAIATIPHGPFLLDKLWPQEQIKNPPTNALLVGGVKYDSEPNLAASTPTVDHRGEPLVMPNTKLSWSFLGNTESEANGVAETAERRKLSVTRFDGENATVAAVLAGLPKAKFAHFATHGFFADESFRSILQLDEKDFLQRGGERIGRVANSPLVMTGLVFAGANNPKTPGRGILTGESLIDLDLSGLELAVLSACETGLGDVAGGEGTFGLQRAFHMAGTRNVIASLWKVPDRSTAALMALFYRNLWEKNLTPMESLRQAQLEIYMNPGKIGELAKGFRGQFQEVSGKGDLETKPGKDGTAHPLLWAAFTLSGPGK